VDRTPWRARVYATGCPRCGLLYARPQPSEAHTKDLYDEGGTWANTHIAREGLPTISRKLLTVVDRITGVTRPEPNSRALDFGCGGGRWLNTLADYGWKTYGIEVAHKVAFARHIELTEIPRHRGASRFGFVVVSHVLEHLRDPGDVLNALGQATEAQGWIYVSVPSLDRLPEHRDWKYVLNARTHLSAYSLDCLRVLLGRAGFGGCVEVTLRNDAGKSSQRLRVLAQKDAPVDLPPEPLRSAVGSLSGAGLTQWRPQLPG